MKYIKTGTYLYLHFGTEVAAGQHCYQQFYGQSSSCTHNSTAQIYRLELDDILSVWLFPHFQQNLIVYLHQHRNPWPSLSEEEQTRNNHHRIDHHTAPPPQRARVHLDARSILPPVILCRRNTASRGLKKDITDSQLAAGACALSWSRCNGRNELHPKWVPMNTFIAC